ncbi:MAG: putative membrane protein YdjX (TVP38/TMEM64 family) [Alphaproteobacteria bacterium]|jgi:uncharacterized membrane protein YdjX (TVP38/TMEM64 family)
MEQRHRLPIKPIVMLAVAAAVLAGLFIVLMGHNWAMLLGNPEALHQWIDGFGWAGPVILIGVMILAIVVSPLPSAPIAMAAGVAYGHFWGTIYIIIGAELGALIAFTIARLVGGERLVRWFGDKLEVGLLGSQNRLTALVFGLRLLPFVSFDIISYAAGLTPLRTWRFALATLAGIAPISFLLTHFGESLTGQELDRIALAVLALGLLTGISVYFAKRK